MGAKPLLVPRDWSCSFAEWNLPLPKPRKCAMESQITHVKTMRLFPEGLSCLRYIYLDDCLWTYDWKNCVEVGLVTSLAFSSWLLRLKKNALLRPSTETPLIAIECVCVCGSWNCAELRSWWNKRLLHQRSQLKSHQCRLWKFQCLSSNLLPISPQSQCRNHLILHLACKQWMWWSSSESCIPTKNGWRKWRRHGTGYHSQKLNISFQYNELFMKIGGSHATIHNEWVGY